jgi:hypothetical protein
VDHGSQRHRHNRSPRVGYITYMSQRHNSSQRVGHRRYNRDSDRSQRVGHKCKRHRHNKR